MENIQNQNCAYCNAKVNLNIYSFCPKCGSPLSEKAAELARQRETKIKLEVLEQVANEIKDEASLKTIINLIKNV